MIKLPVYLDHNATTPCDPRVVEAMLPYFTGRFGNAASRSHAYGWEAEEAVAIAREQVAALIGAEPGEIVFTSGATESDNLAIKGVFEAYREKGGHIVTVATEHKAVLDTCAHIERMGGEVSYLSVNGQGLVDIEELKAVIRPETILISVMYANNETGVIQPIKAISGIARDRGVLFFSDAAQAVGKVGVDVNVDGIDLMAISGHKIYGPKGVGALYVRRKGPRVRLEAQMDGGGHEKGRRSGTLNVPAIVGFGKACVICGEEGEVEARRVAALRDRLEGAILNMGYSMVNGSRESRLPQTTNVSFAYAGGEGLLMGMNKELALSSGSACTSASPEPSYVLKAMGLEDGLARASVRFGIGRFTTEKEVEFAIERIGKEVGRLREMGINK
jgi:cysteine desulfurase